MSWVKKIPNKPPKVGIPEDKRFKLRMRLAVALYNGDKERYRMDEIMEIVEDKYFKYELIPAGARWKKMDIKRALYELQEDGVISIGGDGIEVNPIIEKYIEKGGW